MRGCGRSIAVNILRTIPPFAAFHSGTDERNRVTSHRRGERMKLFSLLAVSDEQAMWRVQMQDVDVTVLQVFEQPD